MEILSFSDIGRKNVNQDSYWCSILEINGKECGIACICDGMGGLNNGDVASRFLLSSIRDAILDGIRLEELGDVIKSANKSIYELSTKDSKMGTTCTVLCCLEGKYTIYHVGDSRCYQISNNTVNLLTTDHSVVNQYGIQEDNELYLKYRSKLTRCIGVEREVNVDIYNGVYSNGDKFLVCSDGFWHYFDKNNRIIDIYKLKETVEYYKELGETDNISVCLLII